MYQPNYTSTVHNCQEWVHYHCICIHNHCNMFHSYSHKRSHIALQKTTIFYMLNQFKTILTVINYYNTKVSLVYFQKWFLKLTIVHWSLFLYNYLWYNLLLCLEQHKWKWKKAPRVTLFGFPSSWERRSRLQKLWCYVVTSRLEAGLGIVATIFSPFYIRRVVIVIVHFHILGR